MCTRAWTRFWRARSWAWWKTRRSFLRGVIFTALFLAAFPSTFSTAVSAKPLRLVPGTFEYFPGPHFHLEPDSLRELSLDAFVSRHGGETRPGSSTEVANPGSSVWARLRIINEGRNHVHYLEFTPVAADIRVYVPAGAGRFQVLRAGRAVPYFLFAIPHRNPVFPISTPPGRGTEIYLRVQSQGASWLSSWMHSREAFRRKDYREQFLFGIFFGIVLIIACLNIFFYFAVREAAYLFYVAYVLSLGMTFFAAHNFGLEMFWPHAVTWNTYNPPFFTGVTALAAVLFAASFLRARETAIPLFRVYTIIAAAIASICLMMIFFGAANLFTPLVILTGCAVVSIYIGGLTALARGYRPARYYIAGWTMLLVFVIAEVLLSLSILPIKILGYEINVEQEHFLAIAVLEMIFLSLALADRYHILRLEKERAQARLHEDRNRIASDIHDSVGAELTGLIMQVENSGAKAEPGLSGRIRLVLQNLRDIVFLLNQKQDIADSLESEMRDYLERLNTLGDFQVEHDLRNVGPSLTAEQALHTLRIFTEWMTNILKHSKARSIKVRLRKTSTAFQLQIINDGTAFSWSGRYEGLQTGLRGIRYRAEALGGRARSRAWKNGTAFALKAPLG